VSDIDDRIGEPSGNDRDRTVLLGARLGEPAGLIARRDDEGVGAGPQEMRETFVVADEANRSGLSNDVVE